MTGFRSQHRLTLSNGVPDALTHLEVDYLVEGEVVGTEVLPLPLPLP